MTSLAHKLASHDSFEELPTEQLSRAHIAHLLELARTVGGTISGVGSAGGSAHHAGTSAPLRALPPLPPPPEEVDEHKVIAPIASAQALTKIAPAAAPLHRELTAADRPRAIRDRAVEQRARVPRRRRVIRRGLILLATMGLGFGIGMFLRSAVVRGWVFELGPLSILTIPALLGVLAGHGRTRRPARIAAGVVTALGTAPVAVAATLAATASSGVGTGLLLGRIAPAREALTAVSHIPSAWVWGWIAAIAISPVVLALAFSRRCR